MGIRSWLRERRLRGTLPPRAELNRRLDDARALQREAERHADTARMLRKENRLGAVVEKALGLNGDR